MVESFIRSLENIRKSVANHDSTSYSSCIITPKVQMHCFEVTLHMDTCLVQRYHKFLIQKLIYIMLNNIKSSSLN